MYHHPSHEVNFWPHLIGVPSDSSLTTPCESAQGRFVFPDGGTINWNGRFSMLPPGQLLIALSFAQLPLQL